MILHVEDQDSWFYSSGHMIQSVSLSCVFEEMNVEIGKLSSGAAKLPNSCIEKELQIRIFLPLVMCGS